MEVSFMEEPQTLEIKQEIQYTNQDETFDLPEFLYHVVYAENIMSIKREGIKPHLTQTAYSDYVKDCLFLSADQNILIRMALQSNKAKPSSKENIFIIKLQTDSLDRNKIFKYDESTNPYNSVFLYHGEIPFSPLYRIYVYE